MKTNAFKRQKVHDLPEPFREPSGARSVACKEGGPQKSQTYKKNRKAENQETLNKLTDFFRASKTQTGQKVQYLQ
jgi:hypothetical protein